jgi:dolichol-phosphate mannosyltransferase
MNSEIVVVIIPTYNESAVIQQTIHAIASIRTQIQNKILKVLIFDSASKDDTVARVHQLQAQYDWLYLQQELYKTGLGSAYYQAMHFAHSELNADVVVEFDADLSHQPKYLVPMLEHIDKHDVVMGSRYVVGGKLPSDWALYRKIISQLGNGVARLVLTRKYRDFTSGFRATRKTCLETAIQKPFLSPNYGYKLDLLWRLHQMQATIHEFPIEFVDREKGQSKLPRNSIIESLKVILTLRLQAWTE